MLYIPLTISFSTNQTTLENITPFMLLRHLPPLPRSGHSLSDPPLEPELSQAQRRIVKDAHGHILIYDLGWRQNFAQVFGWNRKYGWLSRLWCGGARYVYTFLSSQPRLIRFPAWAMVRPFREIPGQKRCLPDWRKSL